ncbi:MAG: hypothetical protein EPO61_15555 [Nitrospirae bacterium]|nr:MAG: hypothetical protein EPO61_15555 [Nitrospirota bacterium]
MKSRQPFFWIAVFAAALAMDCGAGPAEAAESASDPSGSSRPLLPAQSNSPSSMLMTQAAPAPQLPATQVTGAPYEIPRQIEQRLDIIEEWKEKVEKLPILTDKVNFGLNALQWLYSHQDAHQAEGKSQDQFSIRRSEFLFWGRINEYLPRWHALYEFQSTGLTNNTPTGNSSTAAGTPTSATFFRESYIDFRPIPSLAPNLNFFRFGIFRMPFGIYTETSGGLRDVISSPYLTTVGSGAANSTTGKNGAAGTIEFIQERDFFLDMRGRLWNKLDYAIGVMNNNNFQANFNGQNGANSPKAVYSRTRLFLTDVSFVSFTVIGGESNNAGTFINGRGKGAFDRFGVDARYVSKLIPGLHIQGEYWIGHDGANQTSVGLPAQGACLIQTQCGGNGAPGVQRQTWYVYGKYLFTQGPLENWEPIIWYEQFNPNTHAGSTNLNGGVMAGNDLYTRTILGLNYYFENLPPKIQSKLMFNYEFRHHSGNGSGLVADPTRGVGDPFAQNAFYVQFQIRYM